MRRYEWGRYGEDDEVAGIRAVGRVEAFYTKPKWHRTKSMTTNPHHGIFLPWLTRPHAIGDAKLEVELLRVHLSSHVNEDGRVVAKRGLHVRADDAISSFPSKPRSTRGWCHVFSTRDINNTMQAR